MKQCGEAFCWGDTALGGQCPTCSKCRRLCRLEGTAVSAALAMLGVSLLLCLESLEWLLWVQH